MKRKPRRAELGLNLAEYDALLAAQGGGCAICGNRPKTRRLDVDHDHRTGKVRGLLCHRCNRALPSWVTIRWLICALRYLLAHRFAPPEPWRALADFERWLDAHEAAPHG